METIRDINNIKGTKYLPNASTHWKPLMMTSFLSNIASGNKVIVKCVIISVMIYLKLDCGCQL
jgi:hypothetical protein